MAIIINDGYDTIEVIAHKQGGNWVCSLYNEVRSGWVETQLHYSVRTKKDVIDWLTARAQEENVTYKLTIE